MDLATVLGVGQTIISAIQTLDQLKETFSFSHYKDELEHLQETVNIIQSFLKKTDAMEGVLNRHQTNYIERLKDAVYEAEDVLDEFVTLVKLKQVHISDYRLSNMVRSFLPGFSRHAYYLSIKVKDVKNKLDDIASNRSKFQFKVDNKPMRFIKEETSSFVPVDDVIIGRGEDLEKIVGMLLNSDDIDQSNNVSSLAIVGMGGLGKTAFAQLVYNDPRVKEAFELRSWTCIADHGRWNLTELLGKIMKELPDSKRHDITSFEQMHLEVKKQLEGKKYLLVLDDVWNESYHRWQDLEKFLKVGGRGSRIIVTTRSKKTAQIVGGVRVHELQGLSEEESWCLFKRMAFLPELRENPDDDFVTLGKEIVKKCTCVPLAIRVVGSLLHGESNLKWLSFRDKQLASISEDDDTLNNILRLSYHQLDFPVKSCFAYCAIFPKDFLIDKEKLISLWMAQGYLDTEHVGEEYFLILLQRCFFQDLMEDEWGEIQKFKIHDLLHDMAEQVAGRDICRLNSHTLNVGNKIRHLALLDGFCPQESFNMTHIRSFVQVQEAKMKSSYNKLLAGNKLAKWTCLRSLELRNLYANCLPESIGELFHLRYLNLSRSKNLEVLHDSITKLVNLQTLDLSNCISLRELPKDVSNLPDLSTLNVKNCYNLRYMPSGMRMLTHLHTLGLFVVGRESSTGKQCFNELEDLHSMNKLKGALEILIKVDNNAIANYVKEEHCGGAYLRSKDRLKEIRIKFIGREYRDWRVTRQFECEQALLEEMQPHHHLKKFVLEGYVGDTMPRWLRIEDNLTSFHLLNLISLTISSCFWLRCLTSLEKLPHLKYLVLGMLPRVEYLVNVKPEAPNTGEGSLLFPCLEELVIHDLPNLKGWWPRSGSGVQKKFVIVAKLTPCFPRLKVLDITGCRKLKSIPMRSSLGWVYLSIVYPVWNDIYKFVDFFQDLPLSDSGSRIVSIADYESETESSNIDTESTTSVQSWMSANDYSFTRVRVDELDEDWSV